MKLPTLFVSHGSPMFAVEPGEAGRVLAAFGQEMRKDGALRAVLVMSAHWMDDAIAVSSGAMPATWHDFGGFPPELYRLQYPAPGSPALAQQVVDLLDAAEYESRLDAQRPFDHGAWVPLLHMLPGADVPVVQIAIPHTATGRDLHDLGRALAPLRDEGVLIVGSGSFTHNLPEFFRAPQASDAPVAGYVGAFSDWVERALMDGDERLLFWPQGVPHAARAHPTDEHFLPLFLPWGAALAAGPARAQALTREVRHGVLSMAAYRFD
jgi:4,5-DOPA dioxygenase extradiol